MSVIRTTFILTALLWSLFGFSQIDKKQHSPSKLKKLGQAAEYIKDWESAAEYYTLYLDKKSTDYKIAYHLAEVQRKGGSYAAAQKITKLYLKRKKISFR